MNYIKRVEKIEDKTTILASFPSRILAFILDAVCIIVTYILFQVVSQLLGFDIRHITVSGFTHIEFEAEKIGPTGRVIIKCLLIVIPTMYFTLMTYFMNGQTVGKKILGIRIMSVYHHRIGFWHCLERSLGYAASTLEFGLGFIQATWNINRMTLHDKIGETIVAKQKRSK